MEDVVRMDGEGEGARWGRALLTLLAEADRAATAAPSLDRLPVVSWLGAVTLLFTLPTSEVGEVVPFIADRMPDSAEVGAAGGGGGGGGGEEKVGGNEFCQKGSEPWRCMPPVMRLGGSLAESALTLCCEELFCFCSELSSVCAVSLAGLADPEEDLAAESRLRLRTLLSSPAAEAFDPVAPLLGVPVGILAVLLLAALRSSFRRARSRNSCMSPCDRLWRLHSCCSSRMRSAVDLFCRLATFGVFSGLCFL
jgi:hypothetical protein